MVIDRGVAIQGQLKCPSCVRRVHCKPAGQADLRSAQGTVTLDQPADGQYVVVWLTRLPTVAGGFRGGIAEAEVSGG